MKKILKKRIRRNVSWPVCLSEINYATPEQLMDWFDFLPVAKTERENLIIEMVIQKLKEKTN